MVEHVVPAAAGRPSEETMELTVILEEGENGYIIASCPSLPGCHSQGKTEAEALANIREAIVACLLTLNDRVRREAQKSKKRRSVEVLV
jgi:predicted RNase H-like HicB family nuclease